MLISYSQRHSALINNLAKSKLLLVYENELEQAQGTKVSQLQYQNNYNLIPLKTNIYLKRLLRKHLF